MKKVFKTKYLGQLGDIYCYCNEKDRKRGQFLFRCCKGCKHNPIDKKISTGSNKKHLA